MAYHGGMHEDDVPMMLEVSVESEPGASTRSHLFFPRDEDEQATQDRPAPSSSVTFELALPRRQTVNHRQEIGSSPCAAMLRQGLVLRIVVPAVGGLF